MLKFGMPEKFKETQRPNRKRFVLKVNYAYVCEDSNGLWLAVNAKHAKVVYECDLNEEKSRIFSKYGINARKTLEIIPYLYSTARFSRI